MKKKYKVIIDTDPGVDDATALIFAMHDPQFDIKLITTNAGNIHMEKATRNACFLLDLFNKDIPVVEGYDERLGTNTEHAYHMHGAEGLGGFWPPYETKHKPIKADCADAMYEVLKKYPHEVTILELGSHTNLAMLLRKYPDSKNLIKNVIMMGGSLSGIRTNPNHHSFNIRTDAPAFKETVNSRIPVVMCPSRIGRDVAYFDEAQVAAISKVNEVGKFLALTFETYWEPDYPEKILSTCDLSAIYYLTHKNLYKTKNAFIDVDIEVNVGRTVGHFDRKGHFKVVQDVKRHKFQKMIFSKLREMDGIKFDAKMFEESQQREAEYQQKVLAEINKQPAKKPAAKKAPAKKAPTKKVEKTEIKKTTEPAAKSTSTTKKTAPAKKTVAKKTETAAKKTATKATTKKTAETKTPVTKKTAATKSTSTAKKTAPAKKTVAKKTTK
ncbi:MAG: nucleoside hydrolase [Clostridia bacterium]|nr:nucleoside hydrolase [Clostridia bacterium]